MYHGLSSLHHQSRYGYRHKSKLSNIPRSVVSVTSRRDYALNETLCYGTHISGFGVVGHAETHAGVAAYAVISVKPQSRKVKSQTHFYAGARVKAVAVDRTVEGRINPARAELVAGVERQIGQITASAELSHSFFKESYGVEAKSNSKIMARVSWIF
jgi:hypothetical protein